MTTREPLHICVLQPSLEDSKSVFAEVDNYDCTPAHFFPKDGSGPYRFSAVRIKKATAMLQVTRLAASTAPKYDAFVNLCDGAWDEDRAGKEVVEALERCKVPFTGADSRFYEPSKEHMKMMAHYQGVATPRFVFAYGPADVELAASQLRYPLIVKHFNGYSSIGMTERSRVTDRAALEAEAARFINAFGGALIEVCF